MDHIELFPVPYRGSSLYLIISFAIQNVPYVPLYSITNGIIALFIQIFAITYMFIFPSVCCISALCKAKYTVGKNVRKVSEKPCSSDVLVQELKGTVSRILRLVLLYLNQKLFSGRIFAWHKILSLLKGQFTIYKKVNGGYSQY